MASDVKVKRERGKKCILDSDLCVSLKHILFSFNAPISEEQAWALVYQFSKCFCSVLSDQDNQSKFLTKPKEIFLHRDGYVHSKTILDLEGTHISTDTGGEGGCGGGKRSILAIEKKLMFELGVIVYQALDFMNAEDEEVKLSPDLDQLISDMTYYEKPQPETDDEGIEKDAGDACECDEESLTLTFVQVLEKCASHLGAKTAAAESDSQYRAVCRALVTEALELSMFLDVVQQQGTTELRDKTLALASSHDLDQLKNSDWSNQRLWKALQVRLWIQVLRELRRGVQLKKVSHTRHPIEYQMTPYEILMDDIRSRRYKLKQVTVDGSIPPRVKKDAHAIILEFIRSRPPLRKASERKLPPRQYESTPRERLLEDIKKSSNHRLRHRESRPDRTARKGKIPPPLIR
uniref:Protein spire n=1 Tax=Cacopsylla melanoneura TaxID=428564 RepID=A0A8D9ER08_9HEMI